MLPIGPSAGDFALKLIIKFYPGSTVLKFVITNLWSTES